MNFLEALKEHIIVIDGAMGTMIQDLNLTDADFGGSEFKMLSDLLTFSHPDELKEIHLAYLRAGANAIETNTFGASPLRLREYDFSRLDLKAFAPIPDGLDLKKLSYEAFAYHLNRTAARIARAAIEERNWNGALADRPLFVLGSIGPSNWVLSSTQANLKRATYGQIVDNFYHQVLGLIDGGVDVLLYETHQDPLELKAAIHGGQKAMRERGVRLPVIAQVTVDGFGRMQIFNTDILAALATIAGIGVDVFGINCSIGPEQMVATVKTLSQYARVPISVVPNAGLPVSEKGRTVFKLSPEALAKDLLGFVEAFGVNVIGGCCGTRPAHIEALARAVAGKRPHKREIRRVDMVSGPQKAVVLDSSRNLIRIGERLNVRGSKKVRDAVESSDKIDFQALEEVADEQTRELGLDIIDVCLDSNVVNTEEALVAVIQDLTTDFSGVMCIDSFSVEALVKALEVYPGRPILNSISLEESEKGLDKVDAVVSRTRHHHPVYIALCTEPAGPAQTAADKYRVAAAIYEKCHKKYGISADQLIIDVNAFPIGSESVPGLNFAVESLKAIPLVKGIHPDIRVSIGVGNLTAGLAKKPYMRKVLTSVFMDLARKKGMDAAIINPHHYVPVESLDKKDVALGRRVILERDMDAFAELEVIAEKKKGHAVVRRLSYDDFGLEEAICQKIKDGFKQRQKGKVTEGDFSYAYDDAIVPQVARALKKHEPLRFINDYLMKAMQELGDAFGRGEVSLPHLMKSADVMKRAMGFIEATMKHKAGTDIHKEIHYKGVVVIGTVYQDVHSIGKDLVKTLLENYGYRVIDLGVQTPLEKYIEAAKKYNANAIGMSALLVQTANHMITVARLVKEQGLDVDILIGGAPVNYRHAAYVSMWGQNDVSQQIPNVFYCPSGMDGVNIMNQLVESGEKKRQLVSQNLEKLRWHYERAVRESAREEELLKTLPRRMVAVSQIRRDPAIYFLREQIALTIAALKPHLDLKTLFALNWRYGGPKSWEKKGMSEEKLMSQLDHWVKESDEKGWLKPQAVCGIFPCQASGDTVIIYDPSDVKRELARLDFTVVVGRGKKDVFSAAQFFLPKDSGRYDAIGLQIATGGGAVAAQIQKFRETGDTESAHLLQGLSDRVAEDMAEYTHRLLRKKMGVAPNAGTRYSPGYPGLKDIFVNRILADLLKAESEIGVTLTEAAEFNPTGTTGAVVCFHPEAGYD